MLFQEADMGSNNIGVVVNPVRLESLEKFGSPQFVADKLIQAEKRKVAVCYDSSVSVLKVILAAAELFFLVVPSLTIDCSYFFIIKAIKRAISI